MAFINSAIKDAREQQVVPEAEYDLRIQQAEIKDSKSKADRQNVEVMVLIESAEYPNAAPIFHYLSIVHDDDDQKTKDFKLRMQRRFLELFKIPFEDNGFDTDDFAGCTATCLVAQDEVKKDNKPTGEFANVLRLPKFQNEEDDEKPQRSSGGSSRRRK